MGVVGTLLDALLGWLGQTFGWRYGPAAWTAAAHSGFALAFAPTGGAVLVSVIRRFTGNRFGLATGASFLLIGVLSAGMFPWFCFTAVVGGGSPTESKVLLGGADNVLQFLLYAVLLGAVPILGWFLVILAARGAFRRGPRWPRMLFWVPFTLFLLGTLPLNAELAAAMWLGFIPAALLGVLIGRVVPAPSWATISRSKEDRRADRPPEEPPEASPRLADDPGPLPPELRPDPTPTRIDPAVAGALPALPAGSSAGRPGIAADGRFHRIRQLGRGGFGEVWLATDTQLGRQVALKIAHAPDADTEQRMYREARALAAVRHPNCVRVYDIARESDGLALVMEYIDGRSLTELIRRNGPLDDLRAARLWHSMAGALAEAHRNGVLHRDVKPSNVVVDPEGTAHLIDFGIARSRGDATLTASGMMLGTPDFLPPEVAGGGQATPASDAWELAATVSFALTGRPPRGERDTHIAALMAGAHAEPCTELPRRSAHHRLLSAALAPQPARRPDLLVVQRELGGWLGRAAQLPGPPTASTVLARTVPGLPPGAQRAQ